MNILLVEDDILLSRLFSKEFTLGGHTVSTAPDGLEGFEKAKTTKPNLILLDIMMPKLNGLQTLEKLKADPETKNIPVIMLTNLGNKTDAETALQHGAIMYLIKSEYDPQDVLKIVTDYLQGNMSSLRT